MTATLEMRAGLAELELTHGLVKDLQHPRHLQADQGSADAVEQPGHRKTARIAARRPRAKILIVRTRFDRYEVATQCGR